MTPLERFLSRAYTDRFLEAVQGQVKERIAELEAELAWWERNFLTADGDDAPTKLKKVEAEVERLKAPCPFCGRPNRQDWLAKEASP